MVFCVGGGAGGGSGAAYRWAVPVSRRCQKRVRSVDRYTEARDLPGIVDGKGDEKKLEGRVRGDEAVEVPHLAVLPDVGGGVVLRVE